MFSRKTLSLYFDRTLWTLSVAMLLISGLPKPSYSQPASDSLSAAIEAELHAHSANGQYEASVLAIIDAINSGNLMHAVELADAHIQIFPKSQVGHLMRADALSGLTGGLSSVASNGALPIDNLQGLLHQLRNRWDHRHHQDNDSHLKVPANLLDIGDHPFVVVADMQRGRLYLYKNDEGQARLMRDYYMSVGAAGYGKQVEGDNKTPIGVYSINRYIEGRALPDLYGKGAFPVDYPNRYDRFLNRTGYGIWLHGTPSDTYARSPWASEGCFVLSNDDLLDIGQYLSPEKRTPVILSDSIEWLSQSELAERRGSLLAVIDQWKQDWESLNTQAYVSHYQSENFNLGKGDYQAWLQRKAQINGAKTFVQVDLDIQSLFAYPGEKDMFVVRYKQRYLSDNFSGESSKEQLWKRDQSGKWRIIYEG